MTDRVHFGNADQDGRTNRGWVVGPSIDATASDDLRRTADLEVHWAYHPAGQTPDDWQRGEAATTLCLLIRGKFQIHLSSGDHVLTQEGDYLTWGPGVDHLWRAQEDSTVLTIRWRSSRDLITQQRATARAEEAEREVAGLQLESQGLRAQLGTLGSRLVAAEQENAALLAARAELARTQTQLSAACTEADRLRRELDALITSTTWRLTEPGRKITASMRRVLGRVRS